MPLPRASVSRPCHGVELLEILTQGRNILVSVAGPKALEILAKLGWTGDRQNDGYIPSLDSHLSLVLGARSSAIAFPERSGLTRNTFSPFRVTSAWVPQSRTSRTQILVARGWSAAPRPRVGLRRRFRRWNPAQARCAVSVTATSGKFAASNFPPEASSCDLYLGELEPLPQREWVKKKLSGIP